MKTLKTITLFFLFFSIFSFLKADIVLKEYFDDSSTPDGWYLWKMSGSYHWQFQNSPALSSPSGGFYTVFDDNSHGSHYPDSAYIRTKTFDCSGMTSVKLSFYEFWQGLENTYGHVEISTDGGSNWEIIHSNEGITVGSLSDPNHTILDLSSYAANQSDVMLRFSYSENIGQGFAWYIDDVIVYAENDVGISELASPGYLNCGETYSNSENITIRIFNYSNEDVTNVDWSLNISGGASASFNGTFTGTIPADDYVDIFVTTLDMSADDVYHFNITASLTGDGYLANNNLKVGRRQLVQSFPYSTDFNTSRAGWYASGENPEPINNALKNNNGREFLWGNIPYLNGPEGEGNSWYSHIWHLYTNSWDDFWVYSPIFDLSQETNPILSFDIKHQLEGYYNRNHAYVEFSIDGGNNWERLGTSDDPNWYNIDNGNNDLWGNSDDNPVDSWTHVEHDLCQISGEACVQFRIRAQTYYNNDDDYKFAFDNFQISDGQTDDVQPIAIILPESSDENNFCFGQGSSETIAVILKNNTCRPLTDFDLSYSTDGGTTWNTETVPSSDYVGRFSTYIFTFSNTADLSGSGNKTIIVRTELPTDGNPANDVYSEIRRNDKIVNADLPYYTDFNSNNDGWVSRTEVNHRYFRNNEIPYLDGPEGEGKSWYIELPQDAPNSWEWFWVESPVFDFRGTSNATIYMDIKQQLEGYYARGRIYVDYSTDNGNSWTKLGTADDPNWYNHSSDLWSGTDQDPWDDWTTVTKGLCEILALSDAEKSCVKFRIYGRTYYTNPDDYKFAFDNFRIETAPDVGVTAIPTPDTNASGCLYSSNQTVTITVHNYGCGTIYNVPVECQINLPPGHPNYSASPLTFSGTVSEVPPQGSTNYTFASTFDMTPLGSYSFDATTTLTGDNFNGNDDAQTSVDVNFPKINTFPYSADFNASKQYWTASGENPPDNDGRNFVWGDLDAIPDYLNGAEGNGNSWYIEEPTGTSWTDFWVQSPVFDFSTNTNPVLSMDIKHQLEGYYNRNHVYVQYSLDGGSNWEKLGTSDDPNWYNDDDYWTNSDNSPVDAWTNVEHDLCELSGESCVIFRIRAQAYYNNNDDYKFAFDNFQITAGESDDIEPVAITLPDAGDCSGHNSSETVQILIRNNRCRPIYDIPVELKVNGTTLANEVIPGPVNRFDTYLYTFSQSVDLSSPGNYTLEVTTNLATDGDNSNDTHSEIRNTTAAINSFPYIADFNSDNQNWVSTPEVASRFFERGQVPYLNGSQGYGNSWYINKTFNNTDRSYAWFWVESPVFDLSSVTNPILFLEIKHQLYNYYGRNRVVLQYSTDGGNSWTTLGTDDDPNWYERSNYWGGSQNDPIDSWKQVQHNLCNLAGESCVKFRIYGRAWTINSERYYFAFDNFKIFDAGDAAVTDIIQPIPANSGCTFLDNQQVTIEVFNNSCTEITNLDVYCDVSGPVNINLSGVVPSIPAGGYVNYTFTTTFDMTDIGTYNFDAYTDLPDDVDPSNDHYYSSIFVEFPKISALNYSENFNSGHEHYWIAGGEPPVLPDIERGRDFFYGEVPYLNGPEGNGESWYIGQPTDKKWYKIWVESPVFDFSDPAINRPVIEFDIKHQLEGYYQRDRVTVEYSLDGGENWDRLGTCSEHNWYNECHAWTNTDQNPVDQWTSVRHEVCDFVGEECVKFRVKARVYYTDPDDYKFAFDNFKIINDVQDVAVVQYIKPLQSDEYCSFPTNQEVTVQVYNPFCQNLTDIPLTCEISGTINETLNGTVDIPAKSYVNYTFPTTIDMTSVGDYNFYTYTSFANDYYPDNNEINQTLTVDDTLITTFPYYADFNSGEQYWRTGGENPPDNNGRNFVLGQFDYLNGNEENGDSWHIESEQTNSWTDFWVESPVFDLSGTLNPVLSMHIKYQLYGYYDRNHVYVEYSTDGGASWSKLGSSSAPNWYNDSNDRWTSNEQNPVDNWTYVEYGLCQLKNESCVKFRIRGQVYYVNNTRPYFFAFDNFTISDGQIDASILDLFACYGDANEYNLQVDVANNNNNICDRYEPCNYDGQHDLKFDGNDDRVSLGAFPEFNNFTLEYWIKHNGNNHSYARVTSTTSDRFETRKQGDGSLLFRTPATGWRNSGYDLPEDIWTHIAWVSNGSNITLYVNGSNVYSYNAAISIPASDWFLGARHNSPTSNNANISLDELRIWSKALSRQEIRDNICGSLTGSETDLEAYYDMENNIGTTTLVDNTANAHNGTLENFNISNSCWVNPTPAPFGGSNTALQFDADNDRVETPELLALIDWTIEYWIYNPANDGDYKMNVIAEDSRFENARRSDGNLWFYSYSKNIDWTNTNISIDVGAWNHIAIVSDGTQVYFYKNGNLEYTYPNTITILPSQWYIGGRENGYRVQNGIIDEVRIWNKARTQTEISDNMNNTISAQEGLIAYYRLDDGVGSYTATDFSTNNYDATLLDMEVGSCWESSNLATNNNGFAQESPDITSIDISYQIDGGSTVTNTYTAPTDFPPIQAGNYETIIIPFEQIQGPMFGANLIEGGTATASSERNADNIAEYAFDNDIDEYGWGNNGTSPSWLQINYGSGNEKTVNAYRFYCSQNQHDSWSSENVNPGSWTLQASNDGATWTDLHSVTIGAVNKDEWQTFFFDNTNTYQYYRMFIEYGENSSYVHITELQFFNIDPPMSNIFVEISNPNGLSDEITNNNSMYADVATFPHCNDFCINAIEIVNEVTNATSNENATFDPNEDPPYNTTGCAGVTRENTAWYYFTTNCRGGDVDVTFQNINCTPGGTGIQVSITRLDAFPECDISNHTEVFCSDPGDNSDIVWNATDLPPEQRYYITIDGISRNTCDFQIILEGNVSFNPSAALEGSRTVDAETPDYPTFQSAIDSLDMYGVKGPITFEVADLPYNEQIEIGTICGVDENNTITFETWCEDCGKAILKHNSDASDENYTLKLRRTSYITFKNFDFRALGTNKARVVEITDGTNNIKFENCIFQGASTTDFSDDLALIYSQDDENANNITFKENKLLEGSIGIYMIGKNATQNISGLNLSNNLFSNQAYSGIFLQNLNAPTISYNTISTNSTRTDFRGISLTTINNDLSLFANDIRAKNADGYGLFMDDITADAGSEAIIANNMFTVGNSNQSNAIYLESNTGNSRFINIYFNSTNMLSSNGAAFNINTADNLNIKNNNFISNSPTSYNVSGLTNSTEDYNNFLPDFTGKGANSISINPGYFDTDDLHTDNAGLQLGDNSTGINIDIDGETRQNQPFIGADEYLGSVTWTGLIDNDWNKTENWSPETQISKATNIIIPASPIGGNFPETNTNSDNLAECKNLTIENGAHLYIAPNKYLTVWGDLNQKGTLIIQSDATGTGSFINKGLINYGASSTTTVEQYLTGQMWHYISSPIAQANSSLFFPDNFYWYDETIADSWNMNDFSGGLMGWTNASGNLNIMQGYIAYENTKTVQYTGELNYGDISCNLSYTDNTATHANPVYDGWNLVGNPYPSVLNWNDQTNISTNNIDAAIYFYIDDGTGAYDNYSYFLPQSNSNPYPGVVVNRVSGCIPIGQSFFVKANATDASITVTDKARIHNSTSFYKNNNKKKPNTIRLKALNDSIADEVVIRFVPEATNGYDGNFDAIKLVGNSNEVPFIFSMTDDSLNLSINSVSKIHLNSIVPLGLKVSSYGNYRIFAEEIIIPDSLTAFLKDKYTKTYTILDDGKYYDFYSDKGTFRDRFEIIFQNKGNDINSETKNINVYSHKMNLYVNFYNKPHKNTNIKIFDVSGKLVKNIYPKLKHNIFELNNLSEGVYTLYIETNKNFYTKKIVLTN